MPPEINLPVKFSSTSIAMERLKTAVFAHMGDEIRRLTETLVASSALIRTLSRVDVGVLLHIGFLVEAFTTVHARVGAGIAMDQHMGR